ncbi:MAG: hypothetical protein GX666_05305 [Tissierellia bacterium]|jgi:hypothetical protein|nr:hypothetical protein HMPREF0982_02761 [Erysipelotrichaceae bacterium 21_3]MCX4248888.1 hypothetical protein [Bacilli bacterium]MDD4714705.1 hypothetical protein [Candidatus Absconditabacteria bacterium]NLD16987.1 hypothetical protein [Tissierellia bacterium]DAQ71476.1 MAG TPA: tail component [Caudoviricetes sp.]
MTVLSELNTLLSDMSIQTETAKLSDKALDEYVVLVPISDNFSLFCDDKPKYETSEVRLSIFTKGNYMQLKKKIVKGLLNNNFTITDKRYVEYENDTGFHHYNIDVAKYYEMEEM